MCGIAGIMDMHGTRQIDRDALKRMTDALIHRGPDGEGYFIEDGIGFGHRRLAIIDPAGGTQPFFSQSGQTVLTFNGEIYNFRELQGVLYETGTTLKTSSDTEALTELWETRRQNALQAIRGMFAFAAWEKNIRKLTLVRDRLGEKPLYYATNTDGFLFFASELPALLASGLIPAQLSHPAIADYFAYGYVPDPGSIYQGIYKLPPGTSLSVSQGTTTLSSPSAYWQLEMKPDHRLSYHDAVGELQTRLDDAVNTQLVADVPLGAFLSGGVDSSTIVASMSLQSPDPVKTTTIGFEEQSHDERVFASQIATLYGTQHTEKTADLDILSLIGRIAAVYGEPFADTSALPTYLVCQKTREQVTVALSGDGGDELFAGYRRYPYFLEEEKIRGLLPGILRRPLFSGLSSFYPALDQAPRYLRLKSAFRSLSENTAEAYFRTASINRPEDQTAFLSKDFRETLGDYHPQHHIEQLMKTADTDHPLLMAQYVDLKTWLPGRMLTKVDRASMAHSLEVRPPLLDYKLVEWAVTLPAAFKLQGQNGKRILKESQHARVPRDILYRQKQGFDLPVTQWMRRERDNPLSLLETSPYWQDSGIFNVATIQRMITQHKSGQRNFGQELWSIIMFDAFLATRGQSTAG